MNPDVISRQSLTLMSAAMKDFRVVVVNGPRQAGKSTLLELLHQQLGGTRVTLDDRDSLRTARTDPGGLVAEAAHPLMIDEVQRGEIRSFLLLRLMLIVTGLIRVVSFWPVRLGF